MTDEEKKKLVANLRARMNMLMEDDILDDFGQIADDYIEAGLGNVVTVDITAKRSMSDGPTKVEYTCYMDLNNFDFTPYETADLLVIASKMIEPGLSEEVKYKLARMLLEKTKETIIDPMVFIQEQEIADELEKYKDASITEIAVKMLEEDVSDALRFELAKLVLRKSSEQEQRDLRS